MEPDEHWLEDYCGLSLDLQSVTGDRHCVRARDEDSPALAVSLMGGLSLRLGDAAEEYDGVVVEGWRFIFTVSPLVHW